MRTKRILTFLIVLILSSVFIAKGVVFAAGDTQTTPPPSGAVTKPGGGSGNIPDNGKGCPQEYDTCHGARWQYYPWRDEWDNGFTIQGQKRSDDTIYRTVDISAEEAKVCKAAGGFFRYAFVGRTSNQQWGVAAIGSAKKNVYNSEKLLGGTKYREPTVDPLSVAWETVAAAYDAALAAGYTIDQGGFQLGSSLGFFCATYDGATPSDPSDPGSPPPPSDPVCPGIPVPSGFTASLSDESQGWSSVRTQVRMLSDAGNWTNFLYAKPNDTLQWRHCYFPGMQTVANKDVTFDDIESFEKSHTTISSASDTVFPLNNGKMMNTSNWDNIYNITNKDGRSDDHDLTNRAGGDAGIRRVDNNYQIDQSWVGGTYSEKSSLDTKEGKGNTPYHAWVGTPDSNRTWACSWKQTLYKTNGDDPEEMIGWSQCKTEQEYCSGASRNYNTTFCPYIDFNGETTCKACGGKWTTRLVLKDSCEIPHTEVCTHGSGYRGTYYPYRTDKSLYSGDKSTEIATVQVPYNFNMSADIKLDGDFVYAGEAASVNSAKVTVGARYNSKTNGYYATKALGVKYQIMTFVWDTPVTSVPAGANVRYGEEKSWSEIEAYGSRSPDLKNVNVDDIPAGKYFCVAAQVYPADSGSEIAMGSGDFSNYYKKSGADCKPIAKKPSIQIWGGSLFSNGNIETMRSSKTSLLGYAERQYKIYGSTDANVFGSFDELSVMSLGTNENLASGAATADGQGGSFKNIGRFEPTDGGSGFCKYESPLTFANYTSKKADLICGGATNTQSGKFGVPAVTTEKISFITSVTDNKDVTANINADQTIKVGVDVNVITTNTGKNVLYQKGKGALTISETLNLIKGQTYIVHAEGDIDITGDITYEGNYTSMDDVPKVLIYGKNINIHCNVGRIDAAIIADGKIDTCSDSNDINSAANSKQLMINGTIIADSIDLNRTYGASAGKYSSIPAEVVNYDSTLVLWARNKADTGETGVLNTTYIHELAPRY